MDSAGMTVKNVDEIERLVRMSDGAKNGLGLAPNVSQHSLNRLAWFDDADLVGLFDNYPRERLRVWQSGGNLQNYTDWGPVDTTGVTGREMLDCLYKGSLWFNFQRIDLVDEKYRRVSERLYDEIAQQCRGFSVEFIHSYLLVSSPRAMVYLHIDAYENLLFVIRGGKIFYLSLSGRRAPDGPARDTRGHLRRVGGFLRVPERVRTVGQGVHARAGPVPLLASAFAPSHAKQ